MLIQLILLALVYASFSSQYFTECDPSISSSETPYSIEGFKTGIYKIYKSKIDAQKESLEFKVTLEQKNTFQSYKLLISPSFITSFSFNQSKFVVTGVPALSTPSFKIDLMISKHSNWTFIHANYIITNLPSIEIGSVVAQMSQFVLVERKQKSAKLSALVGSYQLKNIPKQFLPENLQIFSFINGVDTRDPFLEANISYSILNANHSTLFLAVDIVLSRYTQSTAQVYLGFILFFRKNNYIKVTTGMTRNLLVHSVVRSDQSHIFTGITAWKKGYQFQYMIRSSATILNVSSNSQPAKRLLQDVEFQISNQDIVTFYDRFDWQTLKFLSQNLKLPPTPPTPPSNIRSQLPQPQPQFPQSLILFPLADSSPSFNKMALNYKCVSVQECKKIGGAVYIYRHTINCIFCRPHSQFSQENGYCQCLPLFQENQNGVCVPMPVSCGIGETYYDGKCLKLVLQPKTNKCRENFAFDVVNKKCICRPGYIEYISRQRVTKCRAKCINNYYIFNIFEEKCVCPTKLSENGACIPCDFTVSKWNPQTAKCDCLLGFKKAFGLETCFKCSQFSTIVNQTNDCICNEGFGGNGVFCASADPNLRGKVVAPVDGALYMIPPVEIG